MTDYEKQANDFLKATGTTLNTEFVEYGPHFDDDKESRNIYKITLANQAGKFSFRFGQSINDSCKPYPKIYCKESLEIYYGLRFKESGVSISITIKTSYPELLAIKAGDKKAVSLIKKADLDASWKRFQDQINELPRKAKAPNVFELQRDFQWRIERRIHEEITKAEKETFLGQENEVKTPPTAYDVLACLTKYDPGSFENFCGDFGYDTDSRKGFKTYKAVKREWKNIERLFNDDQIQQLQEIN